MYMYHFRIPLSNGHLSCHLNAMFVGKLSYWRSNPVLIPQIGHVGHSFLGGLGSDTEEVLRCGGDVHVASYDIGVIFGMATTQRSQVISMFKDAKLSFHRLISPCFR